MYFPLLTPLWKRAATSTRLKCANFIVESARYCCRFDFVLRAFLLNAYTLKFTRTHARDTLTARAQESERLQNARAFVCPLDWFGSLLHSCFSVSYPHFVVSNVICSCTVESFGLGRTHTILVAPVVRGCY